jgi:hypothetical protein
VPEFGKLSLRDLTPLTLQRYFSGLAGSPLAHESKDKIQDVLSSILGSAVQYGLLVKNPVEGIRMPAQKRGKKKTKPHVTPGPWYLTKRERPGNSASSQNVYVPLRLGVFHELDFATRIGANCRHF